MAVEGDRPKGQVGEIARKNHHQAGFSWRIGTAYVSKNVLPCQGAAKTGNDLLLHFSVVYLH